MSYTITEPVAGFQPIGVTDTTQNHALGTVVRANDPTYGAGEFIYLKGVANTAVGSFVSYDTGTFQTTLMAATANKPRPAAVAMSANVASQYGWYQIGGKSVIKKNNAVSLQPGAAVGVKTAGVLNASATGKEVQGALVVASATTSTTTVLVMIDRPHMQGRIT